MFVLWYKQHYKLCKGWRMAEETLLEWANKQPAWARDALRRHATSEGSLSENDKVEIRECVRHHYGFTANPAPVCVPLSAGHLAEAVSSPSRHAILCSLGPVENLNRLAPNQRLRFAIRGLTLVYGENGSGKSGYARIAKKLCRSLSSTDLLGNVFEAGRKPPASVTVRYHLAGDQQVTEATWTDGTPAPTDLSNISVFDSHNARLYVDQENRISYLPKGIALLQRHGEFCAEMDAAFQGEITSIEKRIKVPLPSGYGQEGEIAKLLARLDPKSKQTLPGADEVRAAAAWTDADVTDLQRLESLLANDPAVLAARCRRAKAVLELTVQSVIGIESGLSAETASRLEALRMEEKVKLEAASLAASDRFAGEPLEGVGLSAWRQMYDYAKVYATSIHVGSDRLPDSEGDLCVLCQEPLHEEGAARVRAFNDFVASEAAKAADAARLSREEATNAVRALSLATRTQTTQALAEYAGMDDTRKLYSQNIVDYYAAAVVRRNALVEAVTHGEFVAVLQLASNPLANITVDIAALNAEADAFDLAAREDTGRSAERTRLAALRDRNKLSDDLPTVLARRDDLELVAKLKACCATVERGHISRLITTLRRSLVMQDLEQRILDEIKAFDLSHIPFQVSNHSKDGQSYFGVALQAPATVANNKVLSEGEQRALALACFLGEIASDTRKHGLIIDDPVSSLDHVRLRRVAIRLAEEAKAGRQVIIFTHNILFFNEVMEAASRPVPPIPVHKNFIHSSKAEGFGVISESDPWVMLPVTLRITRLRDRLKELAIIADFNTEEWRAKAKDFYTDLRETWERLVEEVLLGKVVERFNTDVRTQSLKGVVVADADYKIVFWAMKKASERSGHDMAMGRAAPVPTPTDMKDDLNEIEAFRLAVIKRKRDTEDQRKLLEQPPAAEVA
jgi:energy-coupling factor transporter ATP-binding protein EcfA2